MKKILGICLLLLLALNPNVYAKELPTISVGSFDVSIGDRVVVPIQIENNESFSYIGIKVTYDSSCLEYISSKILGLKNASMKGIENDQDVVTMYALSTDDTKGMSDNGTIAEITFQVKEKAVSSSLKIEVTDYGNQNLEDMDFLQQDGEIRILEKQQINQTMDLKQYTTLSDQKVEWSSSNPNAASVDGNGIVTFQGEGKTVITGTDEEGNIVVVKEYNVVDPVKEENKESLQKVEKEKKKENNSGAEEKKKSLFPFMIIVVVVIFLLVLFLIILYRWIQRKKIKTNKR